MHDGPAARDEAGGGDGAHTGEAGARPDATRPLVELDTGFVADAGRADARDGRVAVTRDSLAFVADDERLDVPLADVFDVVTGHVPPAGARVFERAVAVGWRADGRAHVGLVEAARGDDRRFARAIHEAALAGTPLTVVEDTARAATLHLTACGLALREGGRTRSLDRDRVVGLRAGRHAVAGSDRPALTVVGDGGDGTPVEATLCFPDCRTRTLLGRYLRAGPAAR